MDVDAAERRAPGTPPALAGLRVIDFTWVIAGPCTTQALAQQGAEVIRIESQAKLDVTRRSGPYAGDQPGLNRSAYFATFNASKRSLSMDLNTPRGAEMVRRLVAVSDVVVENFTPKAMRNWKLTYEDLARIRPDLVMISLSAHGQSGPRAMHPGIGHLLTGLAGFAHVTGWPDRPPVLPISAYTDYIVPFLGVTAIMAALDYRRRTGKGAYIDLSQTEAGLMFLTPSFLSYSANRREDTRMGNRSLSAAPHGVYPCRGDDRWCSIAVTSDEEWGRLCRAIGQADLPADSRFAGVAGRTAHAEELDMLIAAWTHERTAEQVMRALQSQRVPCGVVQNVADLHSDPQLAHRGHFTRLQHPEMGTGTYDLPGFRLSENAPTVRPAPCFGADNEYVCRDIMGLSSDVVADMIIGGVLE